MGTSEQAAKAARAQLRLLLLFITNFSSNYWIITISIITITITTNRFFIRDMDRKKFMRRQNSLQEATDTLVDELLRTAVAATAEAPNRAVKTPGRNFGFTEASHLSRT